MTPSSSSRKRTYADRNFWFWPNPTGHQWKLERQHNWSVTRPRRIVISTDNRAIPRGGILFGIDAPDSFNRGTDPRRKLVKPTGR